MHVLLFFIPGILLLFSKAFNRKPLTEFLIYVVGTSLSFFVVFPWLIKPLHISLLGFVYFVFIVSTIILISKHKNIILTFPDFDKNELMLVGILLIVLVLRIMPVFFQIAPAGADMSMHSYIARLIYDNDGIPSSYEPLLPIKHFGAYPSGFPTLSAIISLLRDTPIYRSSLFMSCITHALICFGLYIFLLRFFERNIAAATAIAATFLTRSPQWMIGWGGNSTVLALFLFLLAFALIIELKEGFSWPKAIFALLALAAAMITQNTISWQIVNIRSALLELAYGIPFLILSGFGLPVLLKKNKQLAFLFLSLTAAFLLLRSAVALIIPLAVFASPAMAKIISIQKKKLLVATALIGSLFYCIFYMYNSISMCSVTQADLDAFKWIDQTMGRKAVFMNNYGDAGPWIPAITGRAITDPVSEPYRSEGPKPGSNKLNADYVYLGSKIVYKDFKLKKEDLQKKPWNYKLIYINDGAQVWKIL